MRLVQYKNGFRYTSDTLFLWDFAMRFIKKGRLLDIGGGCGILGFLCARESACSVSIIEKQPAMAKLCELNARLNDISASVVCGDFLEFDSERFDVIVSNPPFYPNRVLKSDNESLLSSRYDDELPLEAWLTKAKKLLTPHGEIIFCFDPTEIGRLFRSIEMLRGMALTHMRFVYPTLNKKAKLLLVRLKNSSKAHPEILPPLIAMDNKKPTMEAAAIFARGQTESVDYDELSK